MIPIPLVKHTLTKLETLLKAGNTPPRILQLLQDSKLQKEQNTNKVTEILNYVYKNPQQLDKSLPHWLYQFCTTRSKTVKQKHKLIARYGVLIGFKHLMDNFEDSNSGIKTVHRYYVDWNYMYELHFKRVPNYKKNLINLTAKDRSTIPFEMNNDIADMVKKFNHLRRQYNSLTKSKTKAPEFIVDIIPTPTGHPPVMKRVTNMMLERLRKFQDFVQKHQPLIKEDLAALDEIDLNMLDGTVREAYINFLSESFRIEEDGTIISSTLFDRRLAKSLEVEKLYKEVSKKTELSGI